MQCIEVVFPIDGKQVSRRITMDNPGLNTVCGLTQGARQIALGSRPYTLFADGVCQCIEQNHDRRMGCRNAGLGKGKTLWRSHGRPQ